MQIMIGLLIPFLGTTLGAATVFLMKNESRLEEIIGLAFEDEA